MTVPSSLVVMVPSPSLSNKEKASLNSDGLAVTWVQSSGGGHTSNLFCKDQRLVQSVRL